jgi:hypothetical protein
VRQSSDAGTSFNAQVLRRARTRSRIPTRSG